MRTSATHSLLFLLLLSALIPFADVQAQEVNIKYFSRAQGAVKNGEPVQILYKPRLSFGNVEMESDSAWRFLERDEMIAFGNIQITTPTESIWSDTLYYYTNQELSLLRGRVVIVQDSLTLFGEKVDYNFFTKVAHFMDGIRLEDETRVLIAKTGIYYQNQDSAVFRHQVQLADSAQYAESDSLFINRISQSLKMYSNIFAADSTNNSILMGDYLESDSTGRRYVKGNAFLRNISSDTTDTTFINSHELLLLKEDTTSLIYGYGDVEIWNPKFSSLSDSLFYNAETEMFELTSNAVAWHNNIQLTGPFISVQMDSSQIKQLTSFPNPIAVQEDSVSGRLHQIKGDTLTADFEHGEISRILIHPNSHILYHMLNSENEPDGAVEYISPKTTLYFKSGKLERVIAAENKGYFLPEYDALPGRRLEGFSWQPALRPEKPPQTLQHRWPEIPQEKSFALPARYIEFLNQIE